MRNLGSGLNFFVDEHAIVGDADGNIPAHPIDPVDHVSLEPILRSSKLKTSKVPFGTIAEVRHG